MLAPVSLPVLGKQLANEVPDAMPAAISIAVWLSPELLRLRSLEPLGSSPGPLVFT